MTLKRKNPIRMLQVPPLKLQATRGKRNRKKDAKTMKETIAEKMTVGKMTVVSEEIETTAEIEMIAEIESLTETATKVTEMIDEIVSLGKSV